MEALPYLGTVLQAFGLASVLPVFAAWLAGDPSVLFFAVAIASFAAGTVLSRFTRDLLTVRTSATLALLALVVCSLLAAVPFLQAAEPLDAVFEAFSALTGTGISALGTLPPSLLFWRALLSWLGAAGIIAAFFLLLDSPALSAHVLYRPGVDQDARSPLARLRNMLLLLALFTAIGVGLLFAAGLSPFGALIQSLTAISLAGFDNGIPAPGIVPGILAFLMVLGGISFFLHEKLLREPRALLRSPEVRAFAALAAGFSALLVLSATEPQAAVVQAVSALTTSGLFVPAGSVLLLIAMLLGAGAGSAGGGLKLIRVVVLARGLPWLGWRATHPAEGREVKAGKAVVTDPELAAIALFSFLFFLVLVAAVVALSLLGLAPLDAIFLAAGAQTNTAVPAAGVPAAAKAVLLAQMVLGRLELFPLFLLVARQVRFRRIRTQERAEEKEEKSPLSFFP